MCFSCDFQFDACSKDLYYLASISHPFQVVFKKTLAKVHLLIKTTQNRW